MIGELMALALLAAPAAAPAQVELRCAIELHGAGATVPLSKPMVSTLSGRPVTITVNTGAGDGKAAALLTAEITPTVSGETVTLAGAARWQPEGGEAVEATLKDGALSLTVDAARRYTVACVPRLVEQ